MNDLDIALRQQREYIGMDLTHLVEWLQTEFTKIHKRLAELEKKHE